MEAHQPRFTLISGGAADPLREGTCRRVGCAEPVVDLGLCSHCLQMYLRTRTGIERALTERAVANFDLLLAQANGKDDQPERDWLWALGEHLAAHGIDPETSLDEPRLHHAVLDALGDYTDGDSARDHLKVVA